MRALFVRSLSALSPLAFAAALLAAGCGDNTITSGGGSDGKPSDASVALDLSATPSDLAMPDLVHGPACGASFCAVDEVCELGTCHKDCKANARCGAATSEVCCAAGEVCYLGACTMPGMACGTGGGSDGGVAGSACKTSACPTGQYCETSIGHCLPLAQTTMCEYHPPVGKFAPVTKWEWMGSTVLPSYNQVMMTPMVADLDGDCMPDVVFTTFAGGNYTTDGVIRAVRGDGSRELWTAMDPQARAVPGAQLAIADVDGDGKAEVFACQQTTSNFSPPGALLALHFDGTVKWVSTDRNCIWDAPAVADVNHDGKPEVIVGFHVYDAQTGALVAKPSSEPAHGYFSTPVELDGNDQDGMEIAGGGVVFHSDGTLYWNSLAATGGNEGYPAIADLDGDGLPEVVSVSPGAHAVVAFHHDGTTMWGPTDVNGSAVIPGGMTPAGGGPPTIADFDGNGKPDVAAAGGYGYLVINGQTGKQLWQNTMTRDYSSRVTGSSVFDFDGDGIAEAVYNDELNLRVYEGPDGAVLIKYCSTSGTLWEYPVIVDVDADDHAEIVVMDNNYAFNLCDDNMTPSHTGFHVLGDAMNRWVRTRRIWNEHAYHVTNIADDGTVPKSEPPNWKQTGLNNFRQNVQTKNLFAAPDLVPRDLHATTDQCGQSVLGLVATVLNQGAAGVPAGVSVAFYQVTGGAPKLIGTTKTKGQILPGASETVAYPWMPPGSPQGPFNVYVVVDDDGTGMGTINECDETNNKSLPAMVGCPQIG